MLRQTPLAGRLDPYFTGWLNLKVRLMTINPINIYWKKQFNSDLSTFFHARLLGSLHG